MIIKEPIHVTKEQAANREVSLMARPELNHEQWLEKHNEIYKDVKPLPNLTDWLNKHDG